MRRSYLKEHRPIFYTNLLTNGTLHRHLAEIDQACNCLLYTSVVLTDKIPSGMTFIEGSVYVNNVAATHTVKNGTLTRCV